VVLRPFSLLGETFTSQGGYTIGPELREVECLLNIIMIIDIPIYTSMIA
jgi:hypothetical protein